MKSKLFGLPFCLILTSCLNSDVFKQDFGPEVPSSEVQQKMRTIPRSSPFFVAPGEMAYTEITQQIETNPPILIAQQKVEVLDRKVLCQDRIIEYDIAITQSKLENGAMTPPTTTAGQGRLELSQEEYQSICGAKATQASLLPVANFMTEGSFQFSPTVSNLTLIKNLSHTHLLSMEPIKSSSTQSRRVTFHNLREQTFLLPTPPLVQSRENCGGLNATMCRNGIDVKSVSFDQVVWENEKGYKTAVRTVTSDKTPFFANVLSQCLETNVDVTNNDGTSVRARVTQCETIKDFNFGIPQ